MKNQCPIFTENVILIKKEDLDEEAVEMESTKLKTQYKMNVEEKVKINLLTRGFDNNTLLNNRGLIRATIDETILEVVKNLGIADVVGHFYPIEAIYELSNLEYSTSSIEISDDAFKKGFDEIQQLLNSYSKIGIHPRIGEKYIPMTEGFDTPVIVTDICYCSHKIMVECECL